MRNHHRAEAAKRAGLTAIPCWVAELTDEEAFMQLVLSNAQSELSPLEIGIHALEAVKKMEVENYGRGRKGGISEYSRSIGKDEANVRKLRDVAKVYRAVAEFYSVSIPILLLDFCKMRCEQARVELLW